MEARSYKGHYGPQWLLTAIVMGGLIFYARHSSFVSLPTRVPPPAEAKASPGVSWFFILKLPEISTQHESGVDVMKARLESWLTLLKAEGFHPMLLSDALRALSEGRGLPERTVVTIFNPGYRRTYEMVAPILARQEWPAVWLTDEAGMDHADRRLVTFHTSREMKDSGLWDVGFSDRQGRIRLESRATTFHLGDRKNKVWEVTTGAFARNQGFHLHHLSFLTANSAWLASELLNRLLVEMPPSSGSTMLSQGDIQGRQWGITLPSGPARTVSGFDLKAPLNRRGTKLFWQGTQGYNNFRLHVDCSSLVGEYWVQLRVDEAAGYMIDVIYSDKAVIVVERRQDIKKRLYFGTHRPSPSGLAMSGDLLLSGQRLEASFNGGPPLVVDGLQPPVPGRGILQLYIADKPHGTARADGVHVVFAPL